VAKTFLFMHWEKDTLQRIAMRSPRAQARARASVFGLHQPHRGSHLKVQAYISYRGRCEEALEFYKKSMGAEIIEMMRWKDSPDAAMRALPGFEEKVMNASFRIGDTLLMADDTPGDEHSEFKGMTFAIEVADDTEAERVFSALGDGGRITMALTKTFWTSSFGVLTDKFGVPWMVNVKAPKH
jgi:PhnB protein